MAFDFKVNGKAAHSEAPPDRPLLVGDPGGTQAKALKLLLPLAARISMRKLGSDRPDRWITSA